MTTEETEARLLAEWLSTRPGTPPPEGLSAEVVAAVYAMRPERAPAPRVTIDDVLATVTTGPFAASAARPKLGSERASARGVGARATPARRRPWWMAPALGLGITAALAAVIVIPAAGLWFSGQKVVQEAARSEQMAPAPMVAEPATGAASAPVSPPVGVIAEAGPAPAPVVAVPPTPSTVSAGEVGADLATSEERARSQGYLEKGDGALEPAGAGGAGAAANGAPGSAPASPAPPPPPAKPAEVPVRDESTADEDDSWGWSEGKSAKKEESREATDKELEEEEAPRRKDAPAPEAVEQKAKSTPQKPASTTKAPTQAASAPAAEPTTQAGSTGRSSSSQRAYDALDSRGAASPRDYQSNWYVGLERVATVYADVEALRGSGDIDGALARYLTLAADPDTNVGQDALWRAASLAAGAGRTDYALSLVEKGLARSAKNTVFRSNLLVLKGDLLTKKGNTAGAAAVWAEAARLNDAR